MVKLKMLLALFIKCFCIHRLRPLPEMRRLVRQRQSRYGTKACLFYGANRPPNQPDKLFILGQLFTGAGICGLKDQRWLKDSPYVIWHGGHGAVRVGPAGGVVL
jgi:hypothetical protein